LCDAAPKPDRTTVEDISHFHAHGFEVDDDNDPAPENVPFAATPSTTSCIYLDWGNNTLDPRRINNLSNYKAVFRGFDMAAINSILVHFLHFLPVDFIKEVLLEQMNQLIVPPCLFPEFMRFLALMLLIGTTQGCSRRQFWSTEDVDIVLGTPFCFNHLMSHRCFEVIIKYLRFTSTSDPAYQAPFHCVEELVNAFKKYTQIAFIHSWIACLDESIPVWTSQWTCPG
jgi:Transposase IS4